MIDYDVWTCFLLLKGLNIIIIRREVLTKKGTSPRWRSSEMAALRTSPRRDKEPSLSRYRILISPMIPAFSTEECAYKRVRLQLNNLYRIVVNIGGRYCSKYLVRAIGHQPAADLGVFEFGATGLTLLYRFRPPGQ